MTLVEEPDDLVTRREAIRRVSVLLGGAALVGGTAMFNGCRETSKEASSTFTPFTPDEVAFLDEVADTILPDTKTPGAKAAKTGAFMAVMVTDSYSPEDQKIFRDGMRALDAASKKANNASFVASTPAQRLAVLQALDREQKAHSDAREAAQRENAKQKREASAPKVPDSVSAAQPGKSDANLPDQRKQNASTVDGSGAAAITKDTPAHYFRMMKELTLLGYFTSEIGCTKAQRYVETPGRYDPCLPYTPGEPAWAGHA
jgi:hypothetical protein